ncbi:amidohydrolase family protein [Cryobacterium sp. PH29-G1]|uniref:N-acetylglucosamine-6-phosphate deacetylase n=1 Tax=Cryobacterium sp. PH29-G1 TaxID=3046211 RepID=UPI0024B97F30|nr:amidohydrolase family protein [Cryobacterium sp. PH29-G1]MDJ0347953.1 amidohydrolase family protein [Cryobacterium sp. PH29-G1]
MSIIIHSARLVSGGTVTPDSWVAFEGDTVAAVGTGDGWRALARGGGSGDLRGDSGADSSGGSGADSSVDSGAGSSAGSSSGSGGPDIVDARGRWLTPGFIDIHCHGAGGAAFDDGTAGIHTALAVHRAHGTTRSVLSLVTASLPDLEARLDCIASAAQRDPLILGAHLEGPFLDDSFRGAHDRTLLRAADAAATERLLLASHGYLRQITLAPELPGAFAAIAHFVDAGVVVAVGHSAADYDTTRAAFDAGASVLTHAFNAMPGIHHRAPGPVVAAMRAGGVTLEIINDGVHVHPDVVRLAFAGAPGRIALVTDAMAATGFGDGEYWLGTLLVTVRDGVARLVSDATRGLADAAGGGAASALGAIAGSTLTLDASLRRAVTTVGLPIATAVTALTETPAHAIGRAHDLGLLAPGFAADAVLLSDDFVVEAVFAAGQPL